MKILICEVLGAGAIAHYTRPFANALATQNAEVTVLTSAPYEFSSAKGNSFTIDTSLSGPRVIKTKGLGWAVDRLRHYFGIGFLRDKRARWLYPDIIHLQQCALPLDLYFVKKLKKLCPVVYTVHDVIPHTRHLHNISYLLRLFYKIPDRLIVHTEANRRQLIADFGVQETRIRVIPHGAQPPFAALPETNAARIALGLPTDRKIVLLFGNLRPNKGIEVMLQAMPTLRNMVPGCLLLIVGHADSFAVYDQMIERLGIRDVITTRIGYVTTEQVALYFRAADIVTLPYTSFASQSGVLLQAYHFERPVVVSDVGGLGEVVSADDVGLVVPPRNPLALAESVALLLRSPDAQFRLKENMHRAILTKYDWRIVAQNTLEVYQELLSL